MSQRDEAMSEVTRARTRDQLARVIQQAITLQNVGPVSLAEQIADVLLKAGFIRPEDPADEDIDMPPFDKAWMESTLERWIATRSNLSDVAEPATSRPNRFVPEGMTAEKLRSIAETMYEDDEHAWHKEIRALRAWADWLDTQETPRLDRRDVVVGSKNVVTTIVEPRGD